MGSPLVGPPVVKSKSLSCPNCGGPVALKGFAHTLSVVCPQCLTILDAATPEFTILQTFQGKMRLQPTISLGSRGTFAGTVFELIGFQRREVVSPDEEESDTYGWNEYLLFNPYKGFRYLSEYNGHWNFIHALSSLPETVSATGRKRVSYQARRYSAFDSGNANTAFVLGEFPWQVRVGETVAFEDFVSAPLLLSSETTNSEVTWSQGEYWTSQQIWQAFRLPGSAPAASGIFLNQPSPYTGKVRSAWKLWFRLMLALAALGLIFAVTAQRKEVFRQHYTFTPSVSNPSAISGMQRSLPQANSAFVTDPFEVTGRTSNLEIATRTDLSNNWAYFNFALINETSGTARDFGREIKKYSDEGSPNDSVVVPNVPAGKYYLRVEPEMEGGRSGSASSMSYDLIVRRGVPTYSWLWIAAVLLSIPPIVTNIRAAGFERGRWRESDYAPTAGSS